MIMKLLRRLFYFLFGTKKTDTKEKEVKEIIRELKEIEKQRDTVKKSSNTLDENIDYFNKRNKQ